MDVARANFQIYPPLLTRPNTGDEDFNPNKIASYTKGLPDQSNGEVQLSAYNALLDAFREGSPALFEQIQLGGDWKLVNPQTGLAFDIEGKDCFSIIQPMPPASRQKYLRRSPAV